jgi:DNA-binding NarL/FixJ family response regulator
MPHHVFIVEDHALMRDMIAAYVKSLPDLHVCGTCRTAEEALDELPASAQLVLVDVALPGMSGIDLIREICDRWPDLKCLVCSGHNEVSYVERALDAGAKGYVAKGDPTELADAIQCLIRGAPYLSVSLRERVEAASEGVLEDGCGPIDTVFETEEAESKGS